MLEAMTGSMLRRASLTALRRSESRIGYRLAFRDIPDRFIDGIVTGDAKRLWNRAGLGIEEGIVRWTIGHVASGISSTFDPDAPEYQAWLGGYAVLLRDGKGWGVEDGLRLVTSAQDAWLRAYGDPHPGTGILSCAPLGAIRNGRHEGMLYQADLLTHSDVGDGRRSPRTLVHPYVIAASYDVSNPKLGIKAGNVRVPRSSRRPYETLTARSLIAMYDLGRNVHVVLQGSGAVVSRQGGTEDRFAVMKDDLLRGVRSCAIEELG